MTKDDTEIPATQWGDLWLRGLSAVVLIPAVLLDVWYGGIWFMLFAALLGVLMASEWTNIAHGQNSLQFALHATAAMCGAFLPGEVGNLATLISILIIWIASNFLVWRQDEARSIWVHIGVLYVALPAFALVVLRGDPEWGIAAIVWVLSVVWAADICAYFAGRIIGGPKLAPKMSPKKTWAGLGGAMAGSAIASGIVALFFVPPSFWPLIVLGAVFAMVAQAGDLFESCLKRHFGVKDSGRLIPGHGGIIDRVDGLVAVAVFATLVAFVRAGPSISQGLLVW